MAYQLGIQTTALQGMFRMLREDMPPPDKIFDRLAELVDNQRQIQQELHSLRRRYLRVISQETTVLRRLFNIIKDRQTALLAIAHPASRLITGDGLCTSIRSA